MAHEIVNGANGSVTWCAGACLGCEHCKRAQELTKYWLNYPTTATMSVVHPSWSQVFKFDVGGRA